MTTKAEKETKQEAAANETTSQVKGKSPVNPNSFVLSQAAFQLYTSAAHSKEDVKDRLELLEAYLVKVNAEE